MSAQSLQKEHARFVKKSWGYEFIFADKKDYCGKLLFFERAGCNFSYHYHMNKQETWMVSRGSFKLLVPDTHTGELHEFILGVEECWTNAPGQPHQLIALEDGSEIIEVSTHDDPEDNYRITRSPVITE